LESIILNPMFLICPPLRKVMFQNEEEHVPRDGRFGDNLDGGPT
jgi:hypothetical protein